MCRLDIQVRRPTLLGPTDRGAEEQLGVGGVRAVCSPCERQPRWDVVLDRSVLRRDELTSPRLLPGKARWRFVQAIEVPITLWVRFGAQGERGPLRYVESARQLVENGCCPSLKVRSRESRERDMRASPLQDAAQWMRTSRAAFSHNARQRFSSSIVVTVGGSSSLGQNDRSRRSKGSS